MILKVQSSSTNVGGKLPDYCSTMYSTFPNRTVDLWDKQMIPIADCS